jgi:hypothetical protein
LARTKKTTETPVPVETKEEEVLSPNFFINILTTHDRVLELMGPKDWVENTDVVVRIYNRLKLEPSGEYTIEEGKVKIYNRDAHKSIKRF